MKSKCNKNLVVAIALVLVLVTGLAFAAFNVLDMYPSGLTGGTKRQAAGSPIVCLESNLTHYDNSSGSDGFVNKGTPCIIGAANGLAGVALDSTDAATDYVAIDMEGVYNISITPATSIAYGAKVYLTAAGVVTENSSSTGTPLGISLAASTVTSPSTTVIPVRLTGVSWR